MNEETGKPLDMLNSDVLKWANSIGSNAQTVTEVINSRDPIVSHILKDFIINIITNNIKEIISNMTCVYHIIIYY